MPSSSNAALLELRDQLALTRYADRPRLARELDRLFARRTAGPELEQAISRLRQAVEASQAQIARLRDLPLKIAFDPNLPITSHREEIAAALAKHQVIVVCGATGSGKTTQLPKICIEAGRGTYGLIGHTQPRRIAARALANRLAQELGTTVGGAVGYQVRFNDRTGPDTRVKLMTDGILLRELEHDRLLRRYDTLIIDEAHERSLNIDFLLGILKRLLPQRPELRVIITSATIDPQKFATFFGGAPVIEVSGRSYPVEVRYRPLVGDEDEEELTLPEGIVSAVKELDQDERGRRADVLVFLPGEKQIRDAAEALTKAKLMNTEVLPLYARLSTRDQEAIFEKHSARRIVLATNVAETSLTVPGIRCVVDSGLARISRYSVRGKVQRLPIEPISQASAEQRKGRCGREAEGICIRLYSEDDFNLRPPFTPPEILRTNLASVILQMAMLDLGDPEDFPFVDAPDTRLINDGYRLLQELKAVDENRRITSLGRQIASLPVDPRLARMLVAAGHHGCLTEMLVIAAFLASQDPRERPSDAQQQADQKHAAFADPRSDFVTVLNLWQAFKEQSAALSGNQLRKWARENFLSFVRMREWQELHRQLSEVAGELEIKPNETPASYADLHQAILTGFLGNIGVLDEKREYEGARGSRFVIAPGTPLASKPPKWVVAASLMETTRLYARMVAAVEPQWIEAVGAHLVKRSYNEPHWVEERGFVAAFETTSLYGLTLASRRRVNYGSVMPREAREIFVREALIEGRARLRAPFLDHNRKLRARVEALEAKVRRRDILVDEQAQCEFYLARLPENIHSIASLERWLKHGDGPPHRSAKQAPPSDKRPPVDRLKMSQADLMRRSADEIDAENYPDVMDIAGNRLPLEYVFEPGAANDGVTMIVPEPLLSTLDAGRLGWLVPGWRVELITAILRGLPKSIRKSLVPVPDFAARAVAELDASEDFHAALAAWVTRNAGATVSKEDIAAVSLPDHLRFNLRIMSMEGKVLAEGRDLVKLKRGARDTIPVKVTAAEQARTYRAWEFGDVPAQRSVTRQGVSFVVYPTIEDVGDGVRLVEAQSAQQAETLLRRGVLRLMMLGLPDQWKYARKQFAENRELILLSRNLESSRPFPDALAECVFVEWLLRDETLPRTRADFEAMIERRRGNFGDSLSRVEKHALEILRELKTVREKLAALTAPVFKAVADGIRQDLRQLVPGDFSLCASDPLWPHIPRFLKAMARRIEKIPGNFKRDQELAARVAPFVKGYEQLAKQIDPRRAHPELDKLRWAIEEFRVSLFAQDLRTAMPVSEKRLQEQLEKAASESRRVG
jgi:ATP-dependent helicase HrpA